jgi:hypothetical protein
LRAVAAKYPNVRYLDAIDLFCGPALCRPYRGNVVYYTDTHHLSLAGADRLFDLHADEFRALVGGK